MPKELDERTLRLGLIAVALGGLCVGLVVLAAGYSREAHWIWAAGIVRLVTAAQTAKAPFIRLADKFALLLLPIAAGGAALAWLASGDPIRGLAVLVAATPCPLILAAPVAFIGGVSQAARRGILIKGGGALEALARVHTVMFDKTGTLTVGGARLVAIELAPGQNADDVLRAAASLEQASHHVVASAIVATARERNLALELPSDVREAMGSGLEGSIGGKQVRVGSHQFVFGNAHPADWAKRALRRASWRSALSVFVSVDGRGAGALLMVDELRSESPRAVQALRALEYLHERDVTVAVLCEGTYAESKPYADFLDYRVPWYSARDRETILAGRGFGFLACYLRTDDHVYETYWTTDRGTEAADTSYHLLDLTVFGRQEQWEDSPQYWPRLPDGQHQWRALGRPTAQWAFTNEPVTP